MFFKNSFYFNTLKYNWLILSQRKTSLVVFLCLVFFLATILFLFFFIKIQLHQFSFGPIWANYASKCYVKNVLIDILYSFSSYVRRKCLMIYKRKCIRLVYLVNTNRARVLQSQLIFILDKQLTLNLSKQLTLIQSK